MSEGSWKTLGLMSVGSSFDKKRGDDPFFLYPNFQGGLGKLGSTPSKST